MATSPTFTQEFVIAFIRKFKESNQATPEKMKLTIEQALREEKQNRIEQPLPDFGTTINSKYTSLLNPDLIAEICSKHKNPVERERRLMEEYLVVLKFNQEVMSIYDSLNKVQT